MLKLLLATLVVACLARRSLSELAYKNKFVQFVEDFAKGYVGVEYLERFEVFKDNIDHINEINSKGLSWKAGINQFTDMTSEEFGHFLRSQSAGYRPSKNRTTTKFTGTAASCTSIDWVSEGKITPVKNQGQCGSCWSFSTTGAVEGRVAIATGTLTSLSEQDLVDCSKQNSGCNGGLMDYAFEYIISGGGLCTEDAYPYVAFKHYFCKESSCTKTSPISSYTDVATKNANAMKSALCAGPVSVAIEADEQAFQYYDSGVFSGSCGDQLDHGVLAVGFDVDQSTGKGFWKVKNSWGTTWGEQGYIRIGNDDFANGATGNRCGILESASFPVV